MLVAFDFGNDKQFPSWKSFFIGTYNDTCCIKWTDSMVGHNYDSGKRVIYNLDDICGTWYEKYVVPDS